jgi:hypothetical protein
MEEVVAPSLDMPTCRQRWGAGEREAAAVARKGRGESVAMGRREDRERRSVGRGEGCRGEE